MRILITGATGFAGGHLVEALRARGETDLHGLCRRAAWPPEWKHLDGTLSFNHADLVHATNLSAILTKVKPDWIFHLAGYAHAGQSFKEPDEAWNGNLTATRNLYRAIAEWGGKPRVLYVSSGLIYGETVDGLCAETHALRPASPYAASKAAADLLSYQQTRHPGLDIVIVRPFNHIGPRQMPLYAVPSFARQLAAIALGRQPAVVETGDLSPRRDLTDVRDMVRAYVLLLEKGRGGEAYNVGSGAAVAMQGILDRLVAQARVPVEVRRRQDELRPVDAAVTCADTEKLRRETAWVPQYPLDQTLRDTLDYWLQSLQNAG